MDNSTGDKISLRKATTEEIEVLKAKAAKRDNEQRKKFIPVFIFALLVDLGLTIYKHSIFYFCYFVLLIVAFCFFSKSFSRQITKGKFSVQRGTIVDKRKSEYSDTELYPKVVFESEDGIRSLIAVEKLDYPNFSEGPCIVIKWDNYEDTDVYEIVMLDENC